MSDPLDVLLAQLCSGDLAAAEHFFRAYEPYLRKAVRRHLTGPLRAKFDSADIVQSVLADVFARRNRRAARPAPGQHPAHPADLGARPRFPTAGYRPARGEVRAMTGSTSDSSSSAPLAPEAAEILATGLVGEMIQRWREG